MTPLNSQPVETFCSLLAVAHCATFSAAVLLFSLVAPTPSHTLMTSGPISTRCLSRLSLIFFSASIRLVVPKFLISSSMTVFFPLLKAQMTFLLSYFLPTNSSDF